MREIRPKLAVLVTSCDAYRDLWDPFVSFLHIFWPDCPYRIYLVSNTIEAALPDVRTLAVGDDISWSDNLIAALEMVEEEYVLLFLDDLFLSRTVDTAKVHDLVDWALAAGACHLRLNPYPAPDVEMTERVGKISPGSIYRTSTVVSLWNKPLLRELLRPGETAWQFEIEGSKRSDRHEGFYAAKAYHFHVMNAVIKSKLRRAAYRHMKRHFLDTGQIEKRLMTPREEIAYFLRRQRSKVFRLLPGASRRKIRHLLTR